MKEDQQPTEEEKNSVVATEESDKMFEPASSQTNQKEGEGKENEEELELPRSYSIPNLSYNAEQKEY